MMTQEEIIKRMDYFANEMEAMKYYNNEDENNQKRIDIIENKDNKYIASEKHDGCWAVCAHYSKGHNLIRSRSISKVTGVYGDYTEKLPHLCEEMDRTFPDNSVVLAEICWNEYGTNANTVGTILRCLPPKAVERQKEKKLFAIVFDILMWRGQDMTETPYVNRLFAAKMFFPPNHLGRANEYFNRTNIFEFCFAEAADAIIAAGGEGLVIQRKDNPYMPGTRTAWKTLKLKQKLPELELKVVNTIEPNKYYEGDFAADWQFKLEDGTLVTKPYFYHWKNGVKVELPSGVVVDVTSGLTDDDRAWLASDEAAEKIAAGELFAVVKAMSINDKGSLRHPYLVRLRTDVK